MIFISSIHLNQDHYNSELPLSHFLDFVSLHSLCFKKKKKKIILEYLYTLWSAVSFALTCLLVFCSAVPVAIWYLYSKAVSVTKLGYLYFSAVSLAVINYLYSCFIIYHHSHPFSATERITFIKQKRLQVFCSDRVYDRRKVTNTFFHTLHSILLFLSSSFFLLFCSVYSLLLLFSLFFTPLYLHQFSLRLWPQNLFLAGVFALYASKFL